MKSYSFKVVFEQDKWPDEADEHAIWRAYIPVLPAAHAWGNTQQEAFANLKNAVDLIIEDLLEEGKPIPAEPAQQVQVSREPLLFESLYSLLSCSFGSPRAEKRGLRRFGVNSSLPRN